MIEISARYEARTAPLDLGFNVAAMAFAVNVMPQGWLTQESYALSPKSLLDLNNAVRSTGKIVVWGGHTDSTIFGCPEHAAAFMAWHDWVHWSYQLPWNIAGEAAAAYIQCFQVIREYGADDETTQWCAYILCCILGRAIDGQLAGLYPEDQRAYAQANVARWLPLAQRLSIQFEDEETRPIDATLLAQEAWGKA